MKRIIHFILMLLNAYNLYFNFRANRSRLVRKTDIFCFTMRYFLCIRPRV